MPRDVQFFSEGARLAGHWYVPDRPVEGGRFPAVVLCHGLAGVKELVLPAYAEQLTRAGFAALAFDYRGFGESEGLPGRVVPLEQVADIRNALRFVRSLSEVDPARIALWGTSFGGAHAIVAGTAEPGIRAVVAQVTFASGRRTFVDGLTPEREASLRSKLERALSRAATHNEVLRLSPGEVLGSEEAKAFYARFTPAHPALETPIPLTTLSHMLEYDPEVFVSRLRCPLLVIGATRDDLCPPEESQRLFELGPEPKRLVMVGCGHFETYEGEAFQATAQAAVQWFEQYARAD